MTSVHVARSSLPSAARTPGCGRSVICSKEPRLPRRGDRDPASLPDDRGGEGPRVHSLACDCSTGLAAASAVGALAAVTGRDEFDIPTGAGARWSALFWLVSIEVTGRDEHADHWCLAGREVGVEIADPS